MVDSILHELWEIKDNIAKEHSYDLDQLVEYLQAKPDVCKGNKYIYIYGQTKNIEQSRSMEP
jgi:hypothetical protein